LLNEARYSSTSLLHTARDEAELHVPPLLAMHPLDPTPRLVNLYACGVDDYRDGSLGLPEAPVRVDAEVEDPFPEA